MKGENLNMEKITGARRKAIAESIRTISAGELKALRERHFPPGRSPVAGEVLQLYHRLRQSDFLARDDARPG